MNILLIGSGGREDALARKLAVSSHCKALYIAPGNVGTALVGENIDLPIKDSQAVIRFCLHSKIDFVVIGPEAPLVAGLSDDLRAHQIAVFGPSKRAARVEGSKVWMKQLLKRHAIPTADFEIFTTPRSAYDWIDTHPGPCVVKADGLAAGKGVVVAQESQTARGAVKAMMEEKIFDEAGSTILIEEMMQGKEFSFFILCDGEHVLPFGSACDHKRAFDNDQGPNTGGMGAYSPAPECTANIEEKIMQEIAFPLVTAMQKEGCPYQGVMFLGLMLTEEGPKMLEVNARFGDPECQTLMMRLENDLAFLLYDCAKGRLGAHQIAWKKEIALLYVLATKGYPGKIEKNLPLPDLAFCDAIEDVYIFHAATKKTQQGLMSSGGRVLNVAALAEKKEVAQQKALAVLDQINWQEGFFRRDIGKA